LGVGWGYSVSLQRGVQDGRLGCAMLMLRLVLQRVPTGWGDVLLPSFRPFGTPRFVSGWVFSATSACEVAEPGTAC
jgi:hypothetical protein